MLNREERRGLLWVILFGAVLGAAVILLLFQAGPGPAAHKPDRPQGLPLASLEGRFVDAWSGEPLPPPQVSIPSLDGISDYWLEDEDPLRAGYFRIGGLPAGGPYQVQFLVDGYEARQQPLTLEAGQALDLGDLSVRRLVTLSGWTVSATGTPFPEAFVVARGERGLLQAQGRSDARGAWLLEALPEDVVSLSAGVDDFPEDTTWPLAVDLRDAEQRHERILELPARRTVAGRLTVAGAPAQGVLQGGTRPLILPPSGEFLLEDLRGSTAWLTLEQEDGERTLMPPPVAWEQSDDLPPRVQVECGDLEGPPDRFPVLVAVRSHQTAEDGTLHRVSLASAILDAGEPRTLSFRPAARQEILWLGADGSSCEQEIPDGQDRLVPDWRPPRSAQVRELAQGFLVGAVDGTHAALVQTGYRQAPDWDLSDSSWVSLLRPDGVRVSLERAAAPTEEIWATLRGKVVDGQGAPVAWARVSLFAWSDQEPAVVASCLTDSSGTFHLRHRSLPGSTSLLVESHDQVRVALRGLGSGDPLEIPLPPPAVLLVRCAGSETLREQVRDVTALLEEAVQTLPWDSRRPGTRGRVQGRRQEDGSWRIPGLPPGPCSIHVRLADGRVQRFPGMVGEEPARALAHPLLLRDPADEEGP